MSRVEDYLNERYAGNNEVLPHIIALYHEYDSWGLKDGKFDEDFTSGRDEHFYGYVWEMLLAQHLKSLGYDASSADEGPDFRFDYEGKTIWVEATCPSPDGIPDHWMAIPPINAPARVMAMPHREMLLRWTSALKAKKEQYTGRWRNGQWKEGYLKRGVVGGSDPYVVAISACRLGFGRNFLHEGISGLPFAVETVFPLGPIAATIDRTTGEVLNSGPEYRPAIPKPNGAQVPTDNFLNPDYAGVSAIIGTPAGINAVCGEQAPLVLVHNPNAANPLPQGILAADQEFIAVERDDYYDLIDINAKDAE